MPLREHTQRITHTRQFLYQYLSNIFSLCYYMGATRKYHSTIYFLILVLISSREILGLLFRLNTHTFVWSNLAGKSKSLSLLHPLHLIHKTLIKCMLWRRYVIENLFLELTVTPYKCNTWQWPNRVKQNIRSEGTTRSKKKKQCQ